MSAPLYKNGTAAQIGDVVTINRNGFKSQFIVVALAPVSDTRLGSIYGTPPVHPERCAAVIPYDETQRCNFDLSQSAVLSSDLQTAPHLLD